MVFINTWPIVCATTINHLMYADDLVILSPSVSGLSELMQVCGLYGLNHDIKYNSKKSAVLINKSKYMKFCDIPSFKINGKQSRKLIMWNIWVTLFLIHYVMTRAFYTNADNCMLGIIRYCGNFICVPQKWSWLCLELSALLYILLSCGGIT